MSNVKILDCTLRDGGYVNQWEFGYDNICKIVENLSDAHIDYIECGFVKAVEYDKNKSLFNNINLLNKILPQISLSKFTLMINYGDIKIEDIPQCKNKNILLRVALKKNVLVEALKFCKQLKQKGYKIFINPMYANMYTSEEMLNIIKKVNEIEPETFTIVDTTGSMKESDISRLFYLIDSNLDKNIALGFHSHNSLKLSFPNAQKLLKLCTNRELIIDSTVFGMGRGAGNLCTEVITQYINENYNGKYDIIPILKTIDGQINPIFTQTPWGYSVPYYLAATNSCHPNYATYLADKKNLSIDTINTILKNIPDEKKTIYDLQLIKQLYLMFNDKSR